MGAELIEGIASDRQMMLNAVKAARERGIEYAKAEAEYQQAKYKRVLELKADGVSATLIQLTIKGDPVVNPFLLKRECALVSYESAKEAVNSYKLSARLQEAQLQREWNMSGGNL